MRLVLFATSLQLADNFLPVLELHVARGGDGSLLLMPWTGYPPFADFNPSHVPVLAETPISGLSPADVTPAAFETFIEEHLSADVDLVVLAHGHSYPSNILRRTLQKLGRRTAVAVMQHGIYQDWAARRDETTYDYYFCFGARERYQFPAAMRSRIVPVGLPRLDRMRATPSAAGKYILYVGQDVPEPWIVAPLLAECRTHFKRPVVVRPHPRFAAIYDELPNDLHAVPDDVDIDGPLVPLIAHADFIITAHSTAVIEALYLQKPAVLVPNHGLTCFAQYPALAKEFTAAAVDDALQSARSKPEQIERFLNAAIGGIHYDHSERCLEAVTELLASP